MRRLAAVVLCALALPASAGAARSWAQPQIQTVVEAGLLADSVATFKPQKPLTQRALAGALETLALDGRGAGRLQLSRSSCPAGPSRSASSMPRSSRYLGLGDSARLVTGALRDAGLAPKAGAGSETVARLLGLRINHPAAEDTLELGPNDPATRAEAAYSLARLLGLSGWEQEQIRAATEQLVLPAVAGTAAAAAPPRRLLRRLAVHLGRHVRGLAAALGREAAARAASTAPASSGASSSWSRSRARSALASVLRGRTTYEMSGEVPPAQRIRKIENLQPGDLIFQGANGPKSKPAQVDHAGIYLGGGWFIHSSGNGTTLHPLEGWYRDRFAWARRPLREAGLA